MDAHTLKSVLWLLIWGGLFFFVMRVRRGGHIGGPRHRDGDDERPGPESKLKDPVCGMSVDLYDSSAAAVHKGRTYYFCSASCRDKFEQAPDRYLAVSAQHGEVHHG